MYMIFEFLEDFPKRLDIYLQEKMPEVSRSRIKNLITDNGEAKTSKIALSSSFVQLAIKRVLTSYLSQMLENEFVNINEYNKLKEKLIKNFYLSGKGDANSPFQLNSDIGSGSFYNAKLLFKDNKYPNFVKARNCHTNSYKFAKMYIGECEVLFGICHTSYSFLHSVVKIKDIILDFNYNLVMNEDLYYNLFNFEVLNTVKNSDIRTYNQPLIDALSKNNLTVTDGEVNACFYELLKLLNLKEKTQEI